MEVVPLPRVHAQDVGVPVEVSVIVTDNGAIPEATEVVKLAVGAGTEAPTVMLYRAKFVTPVASEDPLTAHTL